MSNPITTLHLPNVLNNHAQGMTSKVAIILLNRQSARAEKAVGVFRV